MEDKTQLSHHRIIGNIYELGQELGRGAYGITYLCRHLVTKETLACKAISKAHIGTQEKIESVFREASIMMALPDDPNIVQLKAFCADSKNYYLIMELCEGGELLDRIDARGCYTEPEAALVVKTIAKVVWKCHAVGIIHRDLKPENLLFLNNHKHSPLKLIDFGLSVFFKPGESFSEKVGTLYYAAPELLDKRRRYGAEVDIWSAGVTLYVLLSGRFPFWSATDDTSEIVCAILKGDIDFQTWPWPHISDNAKSLVRQMLEHDPNKRLTPQQVLEHPWIQMHSSNTSTL